MLDDIRKMIATALTLSTAEVNAVRDALLKEQATEDARYAASCALIHPEGSSTPINEAYSRAQDRMANLREKVLKEMPSTFATLLALEIATKRRDEAEEHRNMKFDAAYAKQVDGVRPEVRDWWARLARHGVHPHYLKQHSEPTIAIIADLVQWKAKDPTFKDSDNPWRALLGIYASRLVEKPSKRGKSGRSTPGTPKRNPYPGGDKHYMFNEMVSAEWGVMVPLVADVPEREPTITFDCSIYPARSLSIVEGAEGVLAANESCVNDAVLSVATDSVAVEALNVPASSHKTCDPTGDANGIGAVTADTAPPVLTKERATEIASAIYDKIPSVLGIYWPRDGIERFDFRDETLIPALERWIAGGKSWSGQITFLEAARAGTAREFIAKRRADGIRITADKLMARDARALHDASTVGFDL